MLTLIKCVAGRNRDNLPSSNSSYALGDYMRFVLTLALVVAGCASTNAKSATPVQTATVRSTVAPNQAVDLTREMSINQVQLQAGRERVWQAMMEVHEKLGIPLLASDLVRGNATFELANKIRTVAGKPASRYIECGQGPAGARADSYRLVVKLTHLLENPTPETTVLSTTMQAWARNPGLSSDAIPCATTGRLETEIAGMIALRLK